MRILLALNEFPWPAHGGYRQRSLVALGALSDLGSVDLLVIGTVPEETDLTDRTGRLGRIDVIQAPVRHDVRRAVRWLFGRQPRSVVWRDYSEAQRLVRDRAGEYELVWYYQSHVAAAIDEVVDGPTVLDIDDLEAEKAAHRLRSGFGRAGWHYLRDHPRAAAAWLADALDRRRWGRLQHRQAKAADAVIVCSDLDRRRIAAEPAFVIPNGYELGPAPVPGPADGDAMAMVAVFSYEPNRTGTELFANDVLPLVRARRPGATLRLIGREVSAVRAIFDCPGVEVVGEVDDVPELLQQCRLAIVPILSGGGTRIKILEAFACGVPVVSTSVGCEGLDVIDGEHLLVADDPESFADACVRVLEDPMLGKRLARAGRSLLEAQYRLEDQRTAVLEVARRVSRSGSGR